MNSQVRRGAPASKVTMALLAVAAIAVLLLIPSPSQAATGGVGIASQASDSKKGDSKKGGAYAKARLKPNGQAVAPASAPRRVKRAIAAANEIRKTRYKWGGGHGSFKDNGYDCSGAVSYMLRGARMLKAPLASGGLESWGKKRKGKWITVYANAGHTYAVVAGLRWDTSGGAGPRWHKDTRSGAGYRVRHYKGF